MVTDPNNDNILWSGGSFQFAFAVSRTLNSGVVWNRYLLSMLGNCLAIAVAPSNSDIIYAGGSSYSGYPWFFKTTDCGTSWDTLTGLSGDSAICALAVHPANPNIVYACKIDGVFKSTNGGSTWANTGLVNVNSIVIDPNAPETVYAGSGTGVYVNSSGGGAWTLMNEGLGYPVVTDLGIDADRNLYAGTHGSGMYRWQINTGAEEINHTAQHVMSRAYPNPARGYVRIDYTITEESKVAFGIYDIQGRRVVTLVRADRQAPGSYSAQWNGFDDNNQPVAAGVYFYKLSASNHAPIIRKLILVK